MSLLRQRATEVSVLSTLSALRPAAARLRFVRAMRSRSDAELYVPLSHANADRGWARLITDVTANTRATSVPIRCEMRPGARTTGRVLRVGRVIWSGRSRSVGFGWSAGAA